MGRGSFFKWYSFPKMALPKKVAFSMKYFVSPYLYSKLKPGSSQGDWQWPISMVRYPKDDPYLGKHVMKTHPFAQQIPAPFQWNIYFCLAAPVIHKETNMHFRTSFICVTHKTAPKWVANILENQCALYTIVSHDCVPHEHKFNLDTVY